MSVRDASWWTELLERVLEESLEGLAAEYDAPIEELEEALAEESQGTPVTESTWWAEAVRRIEAGGSLRAVARSFGTNPRRVRRGLARAGVRSGGQSASEGNPALENYLDRLGKEPDGDIAEEAGVTAEAVKGERRRLGIAPYRPPARKAPAKPPADPLERELMREARHEDRGQERPRPRRRRVVEVPQVIRRPTSAGGRRRLPTLRTSVPSADRAGGREAPAPPRLVGPAVERESDGETGRTSEERPRRRRVVREGASGFASLEGGRKSRSGRTRLVRKDEGLPGDLADEEPETAAPRRRRRKRATPHGEVRVVDLKEVDPTELSEIVDEIGKEGEGPSPVLRELPKAADAPLQDEATSSGADEAPDAQEDVAPPVELTVADVPPVEACDATVDAAGGLQSSSATDAGEATRGPELVSSDRSRSNGVPRAPASEPAAVRATGLLIPLTRTSSNNPTASMDAGTRFGWQVVVEGEQQSFMVVAADLGGAMDLAQTRLDSATLGRASISCIGPLLGQG